MLLVRYQMDFLARLMVRAQRLIGKIDKGNQDEKNVHRIELQFLLHSLSPSLPLHSHMLLCIQPKNNTQTANRYVNSISVSVSCFYIHYKCSSNPNQWEMLMFLDLVCVRMTFYGAHKHFCSNFERCQSVVCNWFDDVFVSVSARQHC